MSQLVNISEALSLALHGMGLIAQSGGRVSIREIASQTNSSEAHLSKVFQRLARSGLVIATRGPKGGFELSRVPSRITLYDIYTSIEGDALKSECILHGIQCPFKQCLFGGMLRRINEDFIEHLVSHTLEDLVNGDMA